MSRGGFTRSRTLRTTFDGLRGGGGKPREKEFREKKKFCPSGPLSRAQVNGFAGTRAFPGKLKRNNGRAAESNNTHSLRFTYTTPLVPASSGQRRRRGVGFDRKSHIAFYWVGYILPTGLFLLCSFLRVPFTLRPSPPSPSVSYFPAVIWIQSKGSVLSNVHFASVRVKGAVRRVTAADAKHVRGGSFLGDIVPCYIHIRIRVCASICTNTRICMAHIRNPWPVNNGSKSEWRGVGGGRWGERNNNVSLVSEPSPGRENTPEKPYRLLCER